jgi:hypothetical protein
MLQDTGTNEIGSFVFKPRITISLIIDETVSGNPRVVSNISINSLGIKDINNSENNTAT